jgi:hypothetical protein
VKLPKVDPSEVIAAVALLVAGLSAWYARRSWKIAEKANELSHARRLDELQPQLDTEVVTDGDTENLRVLSRGPQTYSVRFRIVESSGRTPLPVEGLWVTGMPLKHGAIGLLRLGEEFSVELRRAKEKPPGVMRLLLHCSNDVGMWNVLVEHEFRRRPRAGGR